jgi:hypothetical protein
MHFLKDSRHINKILYLALIFYLVMIFLFSIPGKHFSNYFPTVFSMNAENIKTYLSVIDSNGDMGMFSFIFILDYFFFILLGCFFYFKLKVLAGHFTGILNKTTVFMAYFALSSILADGIETSTLQYMIHNFKDFPDCLINIQSPFTILALTIDFMAIIWIIFARIKTRFTLNK